MDIIFCMDNHEIRKRNLTWLCESYGRESVAERLGYEDTNYIKVLLSKKSKTQIGNRVAKKIEASFPDVSTIHGWMDRPQWDISEREKIKDTIDAFPPRDLENVRTVLDALLRNALREEG